MTFSRGYTRIYADKKDGQVQFLFCLSALIRDIRGPHFFSFGFSSGSVETNSGVPASLRWPLAG
jgi:hypothetical protein